MQVRRSGKLANIVIAGMAGLLALAVTSCGDNSPSSPTSPSSPNSPSTTNSTPTITTITPNAGTTAGGTSVTITGTNFVSGATVTFGGTPATDVTIVNATSITAKAPAHASGAADVIVTASGRTGLLAGGFTYINVSSAQASNAPPLITRIRARGTRPGIPYQFADLGEEINIAATVEDPDTPVDQLVYEWKATAGTITGSGSTVRWRAPDFGTQEYTVMLTVIDRYKVEGPNGTSVTLETRVDGSTRISVHDSVKEISDMAREFLLDFSLQRPESVILKNFTVSAGCPKGRAAEASDVKINQSTYTIQSYTIGTPDVAVRFAGACRYRDRLGDACAYVPSIWNSLDKTKNNAPTLADGTDQVTAMYEGNRWYLCDSDFIPRGTNGLVVSPFKK